MEARDTFQKKCWFSCRFSFSAGLVAGSHNRNELVVIRRDGESASKKQRKENQEARVLGDSITPAHISSLVSGTSLLRADMGVIKDGTVSGFLPEKEGFAVHYPGYPSSISRAVETLGGTEGILKARSSQSNLLELRFRPEDPYSHPAFGRLRPSCNLLLRISKKLTNDHHPAVVSEHMLNPSTAEMADLEKITFGSETVQQRNGPESVASPVNKGNHQQIQETAAPANLFADIVARVPNAYHFDGMVDYQHVPAVYADGLETVDLMDMDQEESILLVPPLFSPKDVPEKLVLRPPNALSSKSKQEAVVQQRWEMNIEPCLAIDYAIEEIPKKVNWEENVERGSAEYKGLMAVAKLLDERPIWPRRSLKERLLDENLPFGEHLFKRLLFRTAYYFSTGSFQRFWIRKGYDPRKDPDSRIYQRIDFRVPPSLRNHGAADPTDGLHTWRNLCAFRVFPWKCQTSFQLFELDDDYIQQEIRKPLERPAFTYSAGWFSSYVLESLRLRIAVRFLSICPKVGAKDLHKFACERFEKSKRAHSLKRDESPDEEEHQHVNKDSSCQTSGATTISVNYDETELVCDDGKDEAGDEDDNDGDDEIEGEEDEEEEFDEFESLHLDGDDGDFSLQPSYPIGESVSKNYLQELFGGFPSTELGNNMTQYADSSDGEFQIFEDDSGNDNYSDDE